MLCCGTEAIQPEADTQGEERPNTEMMAGEFTPGGQTELHSMLGMERTEENVTTGRQAERPSVSEERVVDDTAHTQLGPDSFEVGPLLFCLLFGSFYCDWLKAKKLGGKSVQRGSAKVGTYKVLLGNNHNIELVI